MSNLFTVPLNSGKFPTLWKSAHGVPVFKAGSKFDIENYRPICILSTPSKIFESIVTDQMSEKFKNVSVASIRNVPLQLIYLHWSAMLLMHLKMA